MGGKGSAASSPAIASTARAPRFHLVLSRPFDLEAMESGAAREQNPRHILYRVHQRLGSEVHVPDPGGASVVDRALARISGKPMHWALARRLAARLDGRDVVYCAGDDVGLPLALACLARGRRPKLAVWVMEPTKKRLQILLRTLRLGRRIDRFAVNTPSKIEALQRVLGVDAGRTFELRDQTDVRFFSPGPRSSAPPRPVVFSAGLERRDYRTLAAATRDLDVDVRLAAVSPNANASLSAFPQPLPANMTVGDYPWPKYRQAFRDCDLVVVPLMESTYSPGLTVVIEAMACGKPVIVTRTPGTAETLIDGGFVTGVAPGDVAGLRAAIVRLLGDRALADAQAARGHRVALERFNSDQVVEDIVALMRGLAS